AQGPLRCRLDGRWPGGTLAATVSARILGRATPAHRDRARLDRESESRRARRTDERPRCDDTEAGAAAPKRTAAKVRLELYPRYARHRRDTGDGTSGYGHERQLRCRERAARGRAAPFEVRLHAHSRRGRYALGGKLRTGYVVSKEEIPLLPRL